MEAETRYHPSSEQLALASTIDESLAALLPVSRLHRSLVEDAATWSGLDEIGIFGISASEEQGGSGLGAAEEALIVMALGRRLAAPSVFATIGATHVTQVSRGGGLHDPDDPRHRGYSRDPSDPRQRGDFRDPSNPQAIRGRRVAAGYRRGGRIIVVEDTAADLVLVREDGGRLGGHGGAGGRGTADDGVRASGVGEGRAAGGSGARSAGDVDGDGHAGGGAGGRGAALHELGPSTSNPIDDRHWLASLREVDGLAEPLARFDPAQTLRLRLIDAAALAGIGQAALDMAVAYAGIRSQFGRPIGTFQAVKHHCANMAIAARCARDQTSFASVAIDEGRPDAALQVECALFVAGTAALEIAGKNIQLHGGIGFSNEADPHLFLKRAQLLIAVAGGLEAANERIANIQAGW